MTDLLGPHYAGALDLAESESVDRHLRGCADCAAEASDVGDVVAALALLADNVADPPPVRPAEPGTEQPRRDLGPVRPPGRAVPSRPDASRPAGRGRSRQQRIALVRAALALAVLLFVGFGTLLVLNRTAGDGGTAVVTVAATASETGTGTAASVFASETNTGVQLRVTATGLRAGTAYELFGVTADGQAHPVGRWTNSSGVREISGEVRGRLGDLSFVTISVVGGPPVVTVHLHGTNAPTPR